MESAFGRVFINLIGEDLLDQYANSSTGYTSNSTDLNPCAMSASTGHII